VSLAERATTVLSRARDWGRRRIVRDNPSPTIYLHIGRSKVGSTTLQEFFLTHRQALEAGGVRYALFGHLKGSVPGVLGFAQQDELAAYARAHPGEAILISNEFLFGWPRDYTRLMIDGLRGLDVRVIAYLRPYDAWACSSYAHAVRTGENRRDFDSYLDWVRPRLSALPHLEAWGDGLGWDRVRVRSIDERAFRWRDLVPDCLGAIGLDPALGVPAPSRNHAPHWATIELLRTLVDHNREEPWDDAAVALALPLCGLLESCWADGHGPGSKPQYLTPVQANDLTDLYNRDLAEIGRRTGFVLAPQQPPDLPARPFLPAFDRVPIEILRDFRARATAADFARTHPQAAAAVLSRGIADFAV